MERVFYGHYRNCSTELLYKYGQNNAGGRPRMGSVIRRAHENQCREKETRTIRRNELHQMVPLADSTIYEMEKRGEFPRRFALSPRCVVWDLAEVEAWLASRRASPVARAPSPDVKQRRSRPVREPGPARTMASRAG